MKGDFLKGPLPTGQWYDPAQDGALLFAGWLERHLPDWAWFPLGVNHWLREAFVSDHPLTWHDLRPMAPRPDIPHDTPEAVVNDIRTAFGRVDSGKIADWYLALPREPRSDVHAFILAEAPSDALIRDAGSAIATKLAGFKAAGFKAAMIIGGEGGAPSLATRDAFIFAALAALFKKFGRSHQGGPGGANCAAIAKAFANAGGARSDGRRPLTAKRVRGMWEALDEHEKDRIRGECP